MTEQEMLRQSAKSYGGANDIIPHVRKALHGIDGDERAKAKNYLRLTGSNSALNNQEEVNQLLELRKHFRR